MKTSFYIRHKKISEAPLRGIYYLKIPSDKIIFQIQFVNFNLYFQCVRFDLMKYNILTDSRSEHKEKHFALDNALSLGKVECQAYN